MNRLQQVFGVLLFLAMAGGGICASPVVDGNTTRVVSLVPTLTETLFAIGAGGQVVGVSDYCSSPPEARKLPRLGALVNPKIEETVLLKPDVVLLYRSQQDFAARLEGLGLRSELFDIDTLEKYDRAVDRLGELTGREKEAGELVETIHRELSRISAETTVAESLRPKVVVVVSRDPGALTHMYQAGPGRYLDQLMELSGGRTAISSGDAITAEKVVLANPDVIIDLSLAEFRGKREEKTREGERTWSSLATVSAVKSHRVYLLTEPESLVPGPDAVGTALQFHELLTGGAEGLR